MSVLKRRELEESPLADLHAIASELGIEGYRVLRREQLLGAILQDEDGEEAAHDGGADETAGDASDGSEAEAEVEVEAVGRRAPRGARRGRKPDAPDAVAAEDPETEMEVATGALDVLPNGSGFLRISAPSQSVDDVYVAPAQIRRCELRAGDQVSGPVRLPRRSERHRSLVRVTEVNGRDPESPEERPQFDGLTPVHPTERLPAPAALDSVPFGKGSRVAIAGAPGAGTTRLLHEVVQALGKDAELTVVLVGARPEEVTDWGREEGVALAGGSFDRSLDAQVQAAELAVERAKRTVEGGGDAVVIVDSLEAVPAGPARRIFGAGRNVEDGGSLTVIAAVGSATEPLRQASTRIVLDGTAEVPPVLGPRSGTQRADLLG